MGSAKILRHKDNTQIMRVPSVSLQLYDQMEAMSQSGLRDPEASATDRTVYSVLLAELRARITRMVSHGCGLFRSPIAWPTPAFVGYFWGKLS